MIEADRAVDSPVVQAADQSAAAVNSKAFLAGVRTTTCMNKGRHHTQGKHRSVPGGGRERISGTPKEVGIAYSLFGEHHLRVKNVRTYKPTI